MGYKIGLSLQYTSAQQIKNKKIDIILLSAYLNHYPTVKMIAKLAQEADIPVLLGGPAFNQTQVHVLIPYIASVPAVFRVLKTSTGITAMHALRMNTGILLPKRIAKQNALCYRLSTKLINSH